MEATHSYGEAPMRPSLRSLELLKNATIIVLSDPLRSFFTVLGVMVGVLSLALTTGLKDGVESQLKSMLEEWGKSTCQIRSKSMPIEAKIQGRRVRPLSVKELSLLKTLLGNDATFSGYLGSVAVIKANGKRLTTYIRAVEPQYMYISYGSIERGTNFDEADQTHSKRVCLLGHCAALELFGTQDPVGREVNISGIPFTVVGVRNSDTEALAEAAFKNCTITWIPLSTGQNRVFGVDTLAMIVYRVNPGQDVLAVTDETARLLRKERGIIPPQKDDFEIVTPVEIQSAYRSGFESDELIGILISTISALLSFGVVTVILLHSCSQRRVEIGLRRALGATISDIVALVVLETVLLSLLGTIIGVALASFGIIFLPQFFMITGTLSRWPLAFSLKTILFPCLYCVLLSSLVSYYPARRAAAVKAVEALSR